MTKFIAKNFIFLASISILFSCGAPRIASDSHDHCIGHKFSDDDYTCSRYNLVKPDQVSQ